jgi:hypothetical protein
MPVVVVAAESSGRRWCSTSTATYGSLDPPTVVVSLARHPTIAQLVLTARRFSLSVLSGGQGDVAVAAGGRAPGPNEFAEPPQRSPTYTVVLADVEAVRAARRRHAADPVREGVPPDRPVGARWRPAGLPR